MNETIKQHFVPRTYLKNFGYKKHDDTYVKVARKETTENKLFDTNIINICAENHLYTLTGSIEERQILERIYSTAFDNDYNSIYSILSDDRVSSISSEQKKIIISTVITMFYRTKKWLSEFNDFTDESTSRLYGMCKQYNKESYIETNNERISISGLTLSELQKNRKDNNRIPMVLFQLELALKLIEAKKNDNINVYKIIGNGEFITSDNPVLAKNINHEFTIPFDINNAYYLPINNKYLVSIFPNENHSNFNKIIRININGEQVANFNLWQIHSSERFIIGTETGLRETKENQLKT